MDEATTTIIRRVFAGDITRAQLPIATTIGQQVYVILAILLAAKGRFSAFVWEDRVHNYTAVICWLIGPKVNWPSTYTNRSGTLGFHHAVSKGRAPFNSKLTPPEPLVELVNELGCTPAITRFIDEAYAQSRPPMSIAGISGSLAPGAWGRQHNQHSR